MTVRACVEAIDANPLPGYLGGLEIVFDDLAGSAPVRARTQGPGRASALLPLKSGAGSASFMARLPGNRHVSASEDLARVVFLPRGARIVLVNVHDLLADPSPAFVNRDINQIVANKERAEWLKKLHEQQGGIPGTER